MSRSRILIFLYSPFRLSNQLRSTWPSFPPFFSTTVLVYAWNTSSTFVRQLPVEKIA